MKPDSRKATWSLLSERTETQPDIQFTMKAIKWIRAMVEEHSGEVGFMGLVDQVGETYIVKEIFYPKHELVNAGTCEISVKGQGELVEKLYAEERGEEVNNLRFWGHSHHTMGTTPSGQDDTQALQMMNNSGAFLIRAICTKNGEMSVSFFDHERQLKFENIKWTVIHDYDEMLAGVISAVNMESNSKEKVRAIRAAVSTKMKFSDDEEYKAIAEEVKELKKTQLPAAPARGSVHGFNGSRHQHNFGRQSRQDFLPGFQRDMFEDDEYYGYGFPYGGRFPQSNNTRGGPINGRQYNNKKKEEKPEEPLLTDQEIESVVDAAWEGETL